MEQLLVYPVLVVQTLDLAGYGWKTAANASVAARLTPLAGWAGAVSPISHHGDERRVTKCWFSLHQPGVV